MPCCRVAAATASLITTRAVWLSTITSRWKPTTQTRGLSTGMAWTSTSIPGCATASRSKVARAAAAAFGTIARLPRNFPRCSAMRSSRPRESPVRQSTGYCAITEPWLTQFRGTASYTVPKIDVLVSTGIQSKPGTLGINGNASATNGDSLAANNPTSNTAVPGIARSPADRYVGNEHHDAEPSPSGTAVRGSRQSSRSSRCQGPEVRSDAQPDRRGHVQRLQLPTRVWCTTKRMRPTGRDRRRS